MGLICRRSAEICWCWGLFLGQSSVPGSRLFDFQASCSWPESRKAEVQGSVTTKQSSAIKKKSWVGMREGGEASQTGLGSPGTSFRRVKTQKQHENRYRTVQGVGRLENATRGQRCPASPGRGAGHNHGVGGGGGPAPRPARRGKEHRPFPRVTKNVPRFSGRSALWRSLLRAAECILARSR